MESNEGFYKEVDKFLAVSISGILSEWGLKKGNAMQGSSVTCTAEQNQVVMVTIKVQAWPSEMLSHVGVFQL